MSIPKLRASKIRQHIKAQQQWHTRHPDYDETAVDVLRHMLGLLDAGVWDFDPAKTTHRASPRVDRRAFRRYLCRGLDWCERHPERVNPLDQLTTTLQAIDAGKFVPVRREELEARKKPHTPVPALGDQEAMKTSQTGAQSRTGAYAGVIDTEEIEQW